MGFGHVSEKVPTFIRRIGDHVIQGSNNSLLVLGMDRAKFGPASIDDGFGDKSGTGTIHMIVGRDDKDPDFDKDKSFIYISMKTAVDSNLDIKSIESMNDTGPSFVVKSDHGRLVCRKNFKLVVNGSSYLSVTSDGTSVLESSTIKLGKDSDQSLVRGSFFRDKQKTLHSTLKSAIQTLAGTVRAAASSLNSAGGDATFSALASTAASNIVSAGGSLQAVASSLDDCANALDSFEQGDSKFLSSVSKTV